MTEETEENEIFDGGEFVFTKRPDGTVVGGGYKIDSMFLNEDLPPMTTFNTDLKQEGGKVSTPFENLAVPAGLFFINSRVPKKYLNRENQEHYNYKSHEAVPDDIMDKLFSLVEVDKKRKRQTRKTHSKLKKTTNKTRRQK